MAFFLLLDYSGFAAYRGSDGLFSLLSIRIRLLGQSRGGEYESHRANDGIHAGE